MIEPIIKDQYTASRIYFASVIGLLFIEGSFRLPAYLQLRYHQYRGSSPSTRVASHWKITVLFYKLLNYTSPIPFTSSYHVADLLRFLVFAALNVVFGLNRNKYTTDFKLYGWLCIANGGIALLMAPRTNPFAILLRVPSPVLLQYHRWVGVATVAHATTHVAYNIMHYIETSQVASSFANRRIQVGLMAWISLVIILITAQPIVRRRFFEVFYYSHALFFVFLVGALIHTTKGPEFLLPGFAMWVIDRAIRFAYNFRRIEVDSAVYYEGNLTKFKVRGLPAANPGQIIWLQIPDVAFLNWHPFTVAKSSVQPGGLSTIAIRGLGGYTNKVQKLANHDSDTSVHAGIPSRMPQTVLRIDGPYGVGRNQWGRHPVAVLIAGGIGITPALSIASHLVGGNTSINNMTGHQAATNSAAKFHIHLLWVVKEASHVRWFEQEFEELYATCSKINSQATFTMDIYVTRAQKEMSPMVHREASESSAEGEGSYTKPWAVKSGRPNVSAWLGTVKEIRQGKDADLNICGPRSLVNEARKAALEVSGSSGIYHIEEEIFEL